MELEAFGLGQSSSSNLSRCGAVDDTSPRRATFSSRDVELLRLEWQSLAGNGMRCVWKAGACVKQYQRIFVGSLATMSSLHLDTPSSMPVQLRTTTVEAAPN